MCSVKIQQARSDYEILVSFVENGQILPPKDDPYWAASSALNRLGVFISNIECPADLPTTEQAPDGEGASDE